MKANYHTHTTRCGHADGTDEAYVLAALESGFDVLGFSDHVPWPYRSGFTSPGVRMHVSALDGYLASVRELGQKYDGKITVLAGFECEHFPEYMGWLEDMASEKRLDYLILGNHYDQTDETGMHFGSSRTPEQLRRYVDSTVKGVQTGLFSYLAHPDLFMRHYGRVDADFTAAAHDLCQACKGAGIPMEYNLHMLHTYGTPERAGYPCEAFFDIVLSEGVSVVIGVDAHAPRELLNTAYFDEAQHVLERFGALHIDQVALRSFGR